MKSEFHDLAELELNSDGQSWGNLGYWENTEEYSKACRDLALLVGKTAKLDSNSKIFDAGFGSGDQLLLWLKQSGVQSICGVNFSKSQTELAKKNLISAGFDEFSQAIYYGDACDEQDWECATHSTQINRVVALDCAYHFSDKTKFFELAYSKLEKGGRIALSDLLSTENEAPSFWNRLVISGMLRISHIPSTNMMDMGSYVSHLEAVGFQDVKIEDISKHVMSGFLSWLKAFKTKNSETLTSLEWTKYDVTARFLDWAYRKRLLRYCLISAVKPC